MKLIFLPLFILVNFHLVAQITVPETKKSFYGVVEATWCGLCGQNGHPATASIIDQTSPKAIYVGLHKSVTSALFSQTGSDLANAFGAVGQPVFTLNGTNVGAYSGTTVSLIVNAIDNYYAVSGADVNAGFEYGIVGDTIYAHTRTTFFNSLNGEYYVGVYIYEDSIWEWQANYDPGIPDMDIWHNHILRASLNGHFGAGIAEGSIAAGTSFNRNFKMKLDPEWNTNQLHVFTIVWKKNGSVFEFVNANDVGGTLTGYVGIEDLQTQTFSLYPNPTSDNFTISGLENEIQEGSIFDLLGNKVAEFSDAQVSLVHLPAGVYVVMIKSEDEYFYQKIVKE